MWREDAAGLPSDSHIGLRNRRDQDETHGEGSVEEGGGGLGPRRRRPSRPVAGEVGPLVRRGTVIPEEEDTPAEVSRVLQDRECGVRGGGRGLRTQRLCLPQIHALCPHSQYGGTERWDLWG